MTAASPPPGRPVTISPLRRRHLRAVLRIEREVYDTPWSMGLYLKELAAPTGRTYKVARSHGAVVGYGGMIYVVREAHVTTLAVRPDLHGRRIGTRILLALVRAAREDAMSSLTLEVRASNQPAQALYRRFGLVPAGVRRGYYRRDGSGPAEDAVVMWAEEIDDPAYGTRLDAIEAALVGDPAPGGIVVNDRPVRLVLGIETSCDETAAAVVEDGRVVRSSIVSSQIDLHARYGGVVPEIAGRAHLRVLPAVVADAVGEAGIDGSAVDAVAATIGPGLIGSLLVGVSAAKALALVWDVPFVGVNHLEAHLYASRLAEPDLEFPMLVLLVSGGHTLLVLMQDHGRLRVLGSTLDDAAGEAFDKVARYLGLGYPGGPAVDRLARDGDPGAIAFPRAVADRPADFSFSGLKTAVVNHVRRHPGVDTADVVASFQEAVVDVLVDKTLAAADEHAVASVCLGGGVAANSRLRERFVAACEAAGRSWSIPERELCTDNAAMVAAAGYWQFGRRGATGLDVGADPALTLV